MTTHDNVGAAAWVLALALVGVGCGDEPSQAPPASFDSEGWIDTSPPGPPGARPIAEGGADDDDDDDDDDPRAAEAYWGLFGSYANGQLGALEGEFFVEDGEQEVCLQFFDATALGTLDQCSQCAAAWEIVLGQPEAEIDIAGACATHAPAQIEGLTLRLGITAEDVMMRDDGKGFVPAGEVFFDDGGIVIEWEHGVPFEPE